MRRASRKFLHCRVWILALAGVSIGSAHAVDLPKKWQKSCAAREFDAVFLRDSYHLSHVSKDGEVFMRAKPVDSNDGKTRLYFFVQTRDPDTGFRHPLMRGQEQFQDMLKYFKGRFEGIGGSWVKGYGVDNLAEFNRLTGQGMAPEEAARRTWTGQQALKAGFTRVHVDIIKGYPGHYKKVEAHFDPPEPLPLGKSPKRLEVAMTGDTYRVEYESPKHVDEDGEDWTHHLYVAGHREDDGQLTLTFNAGREKEWSAAHLADTHLPAILEHFRGRFDTLRLAIDHESPDLLDQFQRLTTLSQKLTPEAAIEKNLVVKRLRKLGYRVKQVRFSRKKDLTTAVLVDFERVP